MKRPAIGTRLRTVSNRAVVFLCCLLTLGVLFYIALATLGPDDTSYPLQDTPLTVHTVLDLLTGHRALPGNASTRRFAGLQLTIGNVFATDTEAAFDLVLGSNNYDRRWALSSDVPIYPIWFDAAGVRLSLRESPVLICLPDRFLHGQDHVFAERCRIQRPPGARSLVISLGFGFSTRPVLLPPVVLPGPEKEPEKGPKRCTVQSQGLLAGVTAFLFDPFWGRVNGFP
jgi:hypothetical protein